MSNANEVHKILAARDQDWLYNRRAVFQGADPADAPASLDEVEAMADKALQNGSDEKQVEAWRKNATEAVRLVIERKEDAAIKETENLDVQDILDLLQAMPNFVIPWKSLGKRFQGRGLLKRCLELELICDSGDGAMIAKTPLGEFVTQHGVRAFDTIRATYSVMKVKLELDSHIEAFDLQLKELRNEEAKKRREIVQAAAPNENSADFLATLVYELKRLEMEIELKINKIDTIVDLKRRCGL